MKLYCAIAALLATVNIASAKEYGVCEIQELKEGARATVSGIIEFVDSDDIGGDVSLVPPEPNTNCWILVFYKGRRPSNCKEGASATAVGRLSGDDAGNDLVDATLTCVAR